MGRRLGFWRRFAIIVVKPPLFLMTRRNWSGMENVPAEGGVIFAVNHLSEVDPLIIAHFVNDAGRWPQFLAKSSLFRIVGLGPFLRAVKQIPVYRGTADAVKSLDAAAAAIRAGDGVIIYPEGTTPKSGDLWPMRGKTGIARLVLDTGAPVVPVVSWGPHLLLDPRTRKFTPRPRTPVTVVAGPPVDLSRWAGAEQTAANLYAITDEIMGVLQDMLAAVRGEAGPERDGEARQGVVAGNGGESGADPAGGGEREGNGGGDGGSMA